MILNATPKFSCKFPWVQRYFFVVVVVAVLLFLFLLVSSIVTNKCSYEFLYRSFSPRDTYNDDDVSMEIYDQVMKKWYNFSGVERWYNDENVSMLDARLLDEIRDTWMTKKTAFTVSYTLREPQLRDPSMGQARAIMDIFQNKKNGFFIESGAYDGETRSNTLALERFFGWSGILIEPDPINFTKMLSKNRKAFVSPSCVSIKSHPMNVSFLMARNIGRIHEPENSVSSSSTASVTNTPDVAHTGKHTIVQCFPLVSYIASLNIKTVDYFSLDIEGNEIEVLKTIPFDEFDIKTLSVEYIHGKESREYLIELMENRGYYVYSFVKHPDNLANDIIFVRKGSLDVDQNNNNK